MSAVVDRRWTLDGDARAVMHPNDRESPEASERFMSREGDEVKVFGRWYKRLDAVVRGLSETVWSGKRGPALEFSHRSAYGDEGSHVGPFVIVVRRGSSRADFYGFENPEAAIAEIRRRLSL